VVDEHAIGERFRSIAGELNERQRRLYAATEARSAGRGGIAATSRATGIAVDTIRKGIAELEVYAQLDEGTYPDKIRVTDAEITAVNLHKHEFHPEWNYCIKPRR